MLKTSPLIEQAMCLLDQFELNELASAYQDASPNRSRAALACLEYLYGFMLNSSYLFEYLDPDSVEELDEILPALIIDLIRKTMTRSSKRARRYANVLIGARNQNIPINQFRNFVRDQGGLRASLMIGNGAGNHIHGIGELMS